MHKGIKKERNNELKKDAVKKWINKKEKKQTNIQRQKTGKRKKDENKGRKEEEKSSGL